MSDSVSIELPARRNVWLAGSASLFACAVVGFVILQGAAPPGGQPAAVSATHGGVTGGGSQRVSYRGVAMQWDTPYRALESFGAGITQIADLGANTLLISTAAYMEHAHSQAIFIDSRRVPAREDFKKLIQQANDRQLHVIVMPIVLLSSPRGSEWRGVIDPPDWDEWWRQYEEFILYFADLARESGADAFTVGSELVSTEKYTSRWVAIVEKVRGRFPGQLGYSANWDHYKPVKFWEKLDFLGMTSYYTLADDRNPSVADIVRKWEPIRDEIMNWARSTGKPLFLTEVGWCSQEGAATAPWNYYQNMKASAGGHEEQRRLYEAFLKAWDNTPGLAGVIWWEWPPGEGGANDYGYTPKGKPAEKVMRDWFAELGK